MRGGARGVKWCRSFSSLHLVIGRRRRRLEEKLEGKKVLQMASICQVSFSSLFSLANTKWRMKEEMCFLVWREGGERERLGFSLFFGEKKKSWGCWLVAAAGAEHKTQLHAGWHAWVYVCVQDSCTPSTVYTHTCPSRVSSRTMVAWKGTHQISSSPLAQPWERRRMKTGGGRWREKRISSTYTRWFPIISNPR